MKISDALIQNVNNESLYTILFIGDSVLAAQWVHPNWKDTIEYVLTMHFGTLFQQNGLSFVLPGWQLRCISINLDGGTTKDILKYLNNEVDKYSPDLVISMGSSNDLGQKYSISETVSNILEIKKTLSRKVTNFVYFTDTPTLETETENKWKPYLMAIREIPRMGNEIFIDMPTEMKDLDIARFFTFKLHPDELEGRPLGSSDLTHPNILGNAHIAKILLKKVFNIEFDVEKYMKSLKLGEKYPQF